MNKKETMIRFQHYLQSTFATIILINSAIKLSDKSTKKVSLLESLTKNLIEYNFRLNLFFDYYLVQNQSLSLEKVRFNVTEALPNSKFELVKNQRYEIYSDLSLTKKLLEYFQRVSLGNKIEFSSTGTFLKLSFHRENKTSSSLKTDKEFEFSILLLTIKKIAKLLDFTLKTQIDGRKIVLELFLPMIL